MRIVITHLARGGLDAVEVAGVDAADHRCVRLAVQEGLVSDRLLQRHGGPFDLGNLIDIGWPRPHPVPPLVEDHVFRPRVAQNVSRVPPGEFWNMLARMARPTMRELFGGALEELTPYAWAAEDGMGIASLGFLAPRKRPRLYRGTDAMGKPEIRLELEDGEIKADLHVMDLRLYAKDHRTADMPKFAAASEQLQQTQGVVLSLALARTGASSARFPQAHWLEAGNIHFKENPGWRLD